MADRTTLWPVRWQKPVDPKQAGLGMQLAARVLADLWPSVQFSVVIQAGGALPTAAWVGLNEDAGAESAADLVFSTLGAAIPWLGIDRGDTVGAVPEIEVAAGLTFRAEQRTSKGWVIPVFSALLRVLEAAEARWQLTMSVGMRVTEDDQELIDFGISLVGSGPQIALAGPLLEADSSSEGEAIVLTPVHPLPDAVGGLAEQAGRALAPSAGLIDGAVIGRMLSLPLRIEAPWPTLQKAPVDTDEVMSVFRSVTPPHVVVVGGSGLGKTTTLVSAVPDTLEAGHTLFVVDPHADFARRCAVVLEDAGLDPLVVDFGAPEPLSWNLLIPPPGVSGETWAAVTAQTIQGLWPGLSADYFGKVWQRSVVPTLRCLIEDPDGPHPLTRFPELLDPDSRFRDGVLARIGDPDLTRVMRKEIMPMLTTRDAGNSAVYLISALDPLIGDPTVSRIVGQPHSDLDLTEMIDGRHIILSVPMTVLTDRGSRVLAGIALNWVSLAIRRRPPRRPIDIFIDEWHRTPSPALPGLLAEGRKFGVRLRLANQNASQISPELWDTALANSGAVVSFRTGPNDAQQLDRMFPTITADSLTRLPKHWVAVTLGERDFNAAAPGPIVPDDDGQALRRGHTRAFTRAELARPGPYGHQLCFDLPEPVSRRRSSAFLDDWIKDQREKRDRSDDDAVA